MITMNIGIFLVLSWLASFVHSELSAISVSKETVTFLKEVAEQDLIKELGTKVGNRLKKIASISKKFGKYAGPAADIIEFALTIAGENQDETEEYLKNITKQLEKIDSKLDAISEQITFLDSKLTQSTKKIISEVKFRDYVKHFEDLVASKQHFESIISSFTTNSSSFLNQLNKYIEDYRQQGSDTKLVNILDSGAGISNSIVDELISLCRSYHKDNLGSSGSSTMKTIYDVYITAFMIILKSNLILESAVNTKTLITNLHYEEDKRYNHYRRNQIFTNFFSSLEKAFSKLDDNDMDGFIDFSTNGNENNVRMINVLQIFWENEDKLSIIDTCSDNCEHFKDRKYTGGGCNGGVKDCKFAVSRHHTERYLRQSPQVDRIYMGYVLNNKWHGKGFDNERDPNMELKQSYLRGFYDCHVCKCVCDQYSYSNTVRRIYTGKISASDGHVIVGIRFIEKNRAIYLQIREGKLLPMFLVDQQKANWRDVPNDNNFVEFNYEKHILSFKPLSFSDSAVTAIQFEKTSFGASWSIYGRKIVDFNKGILGIESQITSTFPSKTLLGNDKIPGLDTVQRKFVVNDNVAVYFGISNEDKDAGQSFVPYFDGNDISFDIKSPLSGISLIHYSNNDSYAGFIRPVIRSLNYKKLFKTSFVAEEYISANSTNHRKRKNAGLQVIHAPVLLLLMIPIIFYKLI